MEEFEVMLLYKTRDNKNHIFDTFLINSENKQKAKIDVSEMLKMKKYSSKIYFIIK